jgi:Uma2 family endonuclease
MAVAFKLPQPSRIEPLLMCKEAVERWPSAFTPQGIESHEPPMETFAHLETMMLLLQALLWLWRDRDDFFAAGNLTIYHSPTQRKSDDFRGPDFFVVLGTHREPKRKSWVVWDEGGKYPNVIVEALSTTTADVDRGLKKEIYQDVFHTPEYFLFDPETKELIGYRLDAGKYQPLTPDAAGRLRSNELDLSLGVHDGILRFFLPSGELVPTPVELGLKAEAEAHRADSAERRARLYADKLRALGIDPDTIE